MAQDLQVLDETAAPCGVVALAASAGGLTALSTVLAALPADFPAAVVVVQHLDPRRRSYLSDILRRRTTLRVKEAADGDSLRPGTVYTSFVPPPTCCSARRPTVSRTGLWPSS